MILTIKLVRVHILHIISSLGRGGKERQLFELVKRLKDEIDLSLIVLSKDLSYPIDDLGVKLIKFDKRARRKLSTHRSIMSHVRCFKPEVIHYWDTPSAVFAIEAKLLYRIRCVDGSIRYAGKLDRNIPQRLLKSIRFKLADRIVANSEAGLRVEGLLKSSKACVIHNGIDLSRFRANPGFSPQASGLDDNLIKIVMVAGFRPAKDHATLIKVAEALYTTSSKFQLIMVGDGENRVMVQQSVPAVIRDKVLFLGNRNDVEQILLHCDIGVLLSSSAEGLSNSIMEYMVAGLPVVATGSGGTSELISEGVTGFMVDNAAPHQVAERIMRLIENPILRHEMGINGRKHINEYYKSEFMVRKYMSLYRKFLEPHALP